MHEGNTVVVCSCQYPMCCRATCVLRCSWHISGGSGWAENTTCKRVLVKFGDGREEVIEIKDDLGMRPDDLPAIKARLRKQGVTGFVDVKLSE